jgi:hypothetical protein
MSTRSDQAAWFAADHRPTASWPSQMSFQYAGEPRAGRSVRPRIGPYAFIYDWA